MASHPIGIILMTGLLSLDESKIQFDGPGWYVLEFQQGKCLTLKVLDDKENSFRCYHQGTSFVVDRQQIKSLSRLAETKGTTADSFTAAEEEKFRDRIEALAGLDLEESISAYDFLRKNFIRGRKILHESLAHRETRVRKLVVKLLGEEGKSEEDLQPIVPLLKDSEEKVRLAAVMALRKLGPQAMDALLQYLREEPVADNRKMAVKTLARWGKLDSARPLVDLLEEEKDPGVKIFIRAALKTLTKNDLGEDPDAWRELLNKTDRRENTEKPRDKDANLNERKSP